MKQALISFLNSDFNTQFNCAVQQAYPSKKISLRNKNTAQAEPANTVRCSTINTNQLEKTQQPNPKTMQWYHSNYQKKQGSKTMNVKKETLGSHSTKIKIFKNIIIHSIEFRI